MPPGRGVAGEVGVVHADAASPTSQARPHSSSTSRASAADGCSPWSTPPPGSVHRPGCAARARQPGQQDVASPRSTTAYAATRCSRNGQVVDERVGHQRRPPGPPRTRRRRAAARRPRLVDPSTSTTRGVGASGAHPAVVDDADRVGVDQQCRRATHGAGGRCRRGRSRRPSRRARSPRGSRGPPRPGGPRRGRRRRRAGSTARCARPAGASRLSRTSTARRARGA